MYLKPVHFPLVIPVRDSSWQVPKTNYFENLPANSSQARNDNMNASFLDEQVSANI
jgi:hypothetical protein